jgi:hypothetical protein
MKSIATVLSLMLLSGSAYAQGGVRCDGPKDALRSTDMLEEIKRQFWKAYPPTLAQQRTREALQVYIGETIPEWEARCCTASRAQCRAAALQEIGKARQWNWQSPPK